MSPVNRQATARADSGQSYSPATGAARETQLARSIGLLTTVLSVRPVPNRFRDQRVRLGNLPSRRLRKRWCINQGKCHCWRDRHGSQDKEREAIANFRLAQSSARLPKRPERPSVAPIHKK